MCVKVTKTGNCTLSASISAMKGNRLVLSDKKTVYLADETGLNMTSKTASGC